MTGTAFGTVAIDPKRIKTLWESSDAPQDAELEQQHQQEIEQTISAQDQEKDQLEENYLAEMQQLRTEREAWMDP